MLSDKEIELYLDRINYDGNTTVEYSTLQALHKAHMYNVPFENLDISLGYKISLTIGSLFKKIILKHRGGFCYELNYSFSELLLSLGFNVKILSARVFNRNSFGKEFDHMILIVELQEEEVIADVGFGDSFREPLLLNGNPVRQSESSYKIEQKNKDFTLFQSKDNLVFQPLYKFNLKAYDINAFSEMCEYHQNSPESNFTQKSICSIATKNGRVTISNGKFIKTTQDVRDEYTILNEIEYRQILKKHFQLQLPRDIRLDNLLATNYLHDNQIQPIADHNKKITKN